MRDCLMGVITFAMPRAGYGLAHPFERTQKFSWHGRIPPKDRELHPVVLVSQDDARAYARWLSNKTG